MALSVLRRSSQSLLVKLLLGAVALSFVIGFGAMSYVGRTAGRGQQGQPAWVAKVNDAPISARAAVDAERRYEEIYRERFGDAASSFIQNLDLTTIAVNQLINERVMQELAVNLGLTVSDSELADLIYKQPAFFKKGQFDRERYVQILRRQKLTPADYETDLRRQLLGQKLRGLVFSSVKVAEADIQEAFDISEQKVDLRFVKLAPGVPGGKVEIVDAEVIAFFEKDKEAFRMPEKRKVEYVVFDASDYLDDVAVTDEQISQYYAENRDREFKQAEQAHTRHILIKVDTAADTALAAAAELKAKNLLEQIKGGADFAKLAAQNSEDPGTKDKGGDLGFFQRGRMVKEFEEAAFTFKPGDAPVMIRSPYGFHIIETLEKRAETLLEKDAVSGRIERKLKQVAARKKARAEADAAVPEFTPGADILNYGNDRGRKVGSSSTFTKADGVPGVRNGRRAAIDLFEMEQGDFSAPFVADDLVYIFKLTNVLASKTPEFDEVADKVRDEFTKAREQDLLMERGRALIAELNAGKSLDAVAGAGNMDVQETGLFSRQNSSVPHIGKAPELQAAAFSLTIAHPVADRPYKSGNGVVVCVLKQLVEPTPADYRVKREELRQEILKEKGDLTLQAWAEQAEKSIKVERNDELIKVLAKRSRSRRTGQNDS